MNENKKGVRAPIRTIKAKNPVAKNASKAIGGGAAGAHKDKKKAAKQGEVKHKKKEVAESYEAHLARRLDELSIDSLKSYKAKRQTQQDAAKAATPNPRTGDKDWIDQAVRGINMNTAQRKINRKEKGVAEGNPWANVIHTTDRSAEKAQREQEHKKQAGLAAKVLKNHSQALDPKEIDLLTRYNLHHRGKPGVRLDNYDVKQAQQLIQNVLRFNEQGVAEAGVDPNAPFDYDAWAKSGKKPRQPGKAVKQLAQQTRDAQKKKEQGVAEEMDIPADGTPEYDQFINRGGVNQKTPFDLGGADAYYGRQNDITREYGFQKGSPEWDEYIQGYRDTHSNKDMRKDYGSSRSSVQPRRITKTGEAMNGITGPGMMRDPAMEDEGDKEGLEHLTPELAQHIADQIDSEGVHAIVKSVEWGDGAAVELAEFIKAALLKFANADVKEDSALTQHRKRSAQADADFAKREAERKKNPGKQLNKNLSDLEKRYPAKEGWTHDSLADRLFEHERTYEEQLAGKLAKQLKK